MDEQILFHRSLPTTTGGPITTQELYFSEPYGFHRLRKATMVYHLKPKNYNGGPIFFQNRYCQCMSEHFGHASLNPKKIT